MRYVLDSTVLIDQLRGYSPGVGVLRRLFEETGDLYTCDVVACEALSAGAEPEVWSATQLLDTLEYVAIDPEASRWAGDRRREQVQAHRRKPSVSDSLIAGLAWRLGATVVTRNARDFDAFEVPVLGYGEPLS